MRRAAERRFEDLFDNARDAIYVHDLATGDATFSANEHRGRVWDLAFTPDGRRLITGGDDYTARIWKLPI